MTEPGGIEPAEQTETARVLDLMARPAPAGADVEAIPEEVDVDPPVRGGSLLRPLEHIFLALDRLLARAVPESLNPLLHTGAIAVSAVIVATISGVLLLIWYRPSVHLAYSSVAAMSAAPWTAGLLRSLHRYSSDVCVFFTLVHALRLFFARRFGGPRWLAWVTGVAMVGIIWLIGWTGYWLVWDQRAQRVALGTARALDVVPIFAEPMSRSFLLDTSVNSLLFFVVFFVHMLIPLGLGIALYLHVVRVSRPRFLTRQPMTIWLLASLLLVSAVYPAGSAEPARMTDLGQTFSMDWWYLLPLALTDRLTGGALWAGLLLGGAVLGGVPWWLPRGRARPAHVNVPRCNACQKCYADCPYQAISMVPRTDGHPRHTIQAEVDPAKCVGCGICAGACDTAGIGLDWFSVSGQRKRFAVWLKQAAENGEPPYVAFVCTQSVGSVFDIDPQTGRCPELPGYFVLEVPCAGWLQPLGVEHTLRYGGQGVLVVRCAEGGCRYREGSTWARMRLDGEREPVLRVEKAPRERVRLLTVDRTGRDEVLRAAAAFRAGEAETPARAPSRGAAGLAAALLAALVAGLTGLVSDLGYASPRPAGSELVVSFKHPGQVSEDCRELSPEEQARLPQHMRQQRICDRARAAVRLAVDVDGQRVVEASFPPSGIWGDGSSVAVERIAIEPGEHRVRVAIGDGPDPTEWNHVDEQTIEFGTTARRVVLFDRLSGFSWN